MTAPWLDVVGIGEAGLAGLAPPARAALDDADLIMGSERFPQLPPAISARRLPWSSPFAAMIAAIRAERGQRLVLLVTGDPLWYSVGARLLKAIPGAEIRFHPHVSAFQLAAARMRWSLADVEALATGPADLQTIAARCGAPRLRRVETVGEARAAHPCPASVFLGDPDASTVAARRSALPPHGWLLAEARDEPGAARLAAFQVAHGGALERIACARPAGGGGRTDATPVTHWRLTL